MKLKLASVGLGVLLLALFASSAVAYVYHPTLQEGAAERRTLKFLHDYPGWRYREVGYLDCRFGRINRYTWVCRVGWRQGSKCRQGRVRITNSYHQEGVTHYFVSAGIRRC